MSIRIFAFIVALLLLPGCRAHMQWGDPPPQVASSASSQSAEASPATKGCITKDAEWDEWHSRVDRRGGSGRDPFPTYRLSKQRDSGWRTTRTCVSGSFDGAKHIPGAPFGWFNHPNPRR